MTQLKLMKKEWFNWFDKTFLDNITAWTEYYYINPDSQHWISNNFIDLLDKTLTNSGVTAVIQDGVITLNGTATAVGAFYDIYRGISYNCGYGCYHYGSLTNGSVNIIANVSGTAYNSYSNRSHTTNDFIREVNTNMVNGSYGLSIVFASGTTFTNYQLKPMVWKNGKTAPSAFNPHLIKIEDILNVVNLEDVDWSETSSPDKHIFRTKLSTNNIKPFPRSDLPGTIFIPGYKTLGWNPISSSDNLCCAISPETQDRFNIINHDFSDIDSWKEYVKGKYGIFLKADSPY